MSRAIISVENLGKCYLLGHQSERADRYATLRDQIGRQLAAIATRTRDLFSGQQVIQGDQIEQFWALDDVSFEVEQGAVLGVVGHNGAGKSTLLKILSRITDPTRGRVTLRGRVASLLEVGTGFHPELTGRENIYLNGAILGMTRREIASKFDEIVSFSEVERFLDTPVKRYSSGMYVRLAFAVAAHMDPEILIVDEVLAVGDAQFQRKCMGKMQDVSRQEGRTVLFVSHNMAAIKALCTQALCLERGKVVATGATDSVLQRYLSCGGFKNDGVLPKSRLRQYGSGEFQFLSIQLANAAGSRTQTIETGSPVDATICFELLRPIDGFFIEVGIVDSEGRQITQSRYPDHSLPGLKLAAGEYQMNLVSNLQLFPGSYSVLLAAHQLDGATIDWVERALDFEILNAPSDSPLHHPWTIRGLFRPSDTWSAPVPSSVNSPMLIDAISSSRVANE